jgi:hypothetical protein
MKKLYVSLFLFFGFVMISQAQVVNIPAAAKEHFLKTYTAATEAKWSNNVTNYTVKFKDKGAVCRAHYRLDGTWDFTETLMDKDKMPEAIKSSLSKSRFSDWKVESLAEVRNDNKQHLYRVEVKSGVQKQFVFYDVNGKEVKTSPKL